MRLLYGSQNFGYDTEYSDKDWLKFVYPCWEEIIKNEITNKELHNEDGSQTKLKDIRLIPKMIKKANFNDLQFLFSQEKYDCGDLKWFFDNRQELIRVDMWQLFCSNVGYIKSQLKENTDKSIIRAYAFTNYLSFILQDDLEFVLRIDSLRNARNVIGYDIRFKKSFVDWINEEIKLLESKYVYYKHKQNDLLIQEMYCEIERLVKESLK